VYNRCGKKVVATKRLTIFKPPAVLALHLKRFQFSGMMGHTPFGGKINKQIDFAAKLDLKPYLSNKSTNDTTYSLYAVLVHAGGSAHR
jgi:ubiquitin carboxyl-terminal hydrolase 36/42